MNLDSIKFVMHPDSLDFKESKYDRSIVEHVDGKVDTKFILEPWKRLKQLGLNRIEILPRNNEVIVCCSAKMLQEQYLECININNVERLHCGLKLHVSCSLDDVLDSTLCKADITTNLYFDDVAETMKSLKLGKSNTGFKVDDFTDRKGSMIFVGRQTSYKNRQIYYNKFTELKLAHNRDILGILHKNNVKDIDRILRVEQNITCFEKLRQAMGWHKDIKGEVKLGQILNSNAKPLYRRHSKIMEYANQVDLFNEYKDWRWGEIIEWEGLNGLYKRCNSNVELLLDFLKEKCAGNDRRKMNQNYYKWKMKVQTAFSNSIGSLSLNSATNIEGQLVEKNDYFDTLTLIGAMLLVA